MKVVILKNGETKTYNDSYALRLIEQGIAVPAIEKPKPEKEPEAPAVKAGAKPADKPDSKPAAKDRK